MDMNLHNMYSGAKETFLGGFGDDTINGNDVLTGGKGKDILTGGADKDKFVLVSGSGADKITDFEDGIDSLKLKGNLSFGQLTIVDAGRNTEIFKGNELLATLVGIKDSSLITIDDFS